MHGLQINHLAEEFWELRFTHLKVATVENPWSMEMTTGFQRKRNGRVFMIFNTDVVEDS